MDTSDVAQSNIISKAIRINKLKLKKISFQSHKKNKIPISYDDKPLVIQTPFMPIIDAVGQTHIENMYQMITHIDTENKDIKSFAETIDQLEEKAIKHVTTTGKKLFDSSDVSFIALIRENKDQSIPSIKWLFNNSDIDFVDEERNPFDMSKIDSNYLIKLIVEIPHIWIKPKDRQFGLASIAVKGCLKLKPQTITKPRIQSSQKYDFDNSSSSSSVSDDMTSLYATESIKPNRNYSLNNKTHDHKSKHQSQLHISTSDGSDTDNKQRVEINNFVSKHSVSASSESLSDGDLIPLSSNLKSKLGIGKMFNKKYSDNIEIELVNRSDESSVSYDSGKEYSFL